MSYENDVEAENARLRAGLTAAMDEWRSATGFISPGHASRCIQETHAALEQARDCARTALRERDEKQTQLVEWSVAIGTHMPSVAAAQMRDVKRERDEARSACAEFERGAIDAAHEREEARHMQSSLETQLLLAQNERDAAREAAESQAAHWQRAANEFDQRCTRAEADCAAMRGVVDAVRPMLEELDRSGHLSSANLILERRWEDWEQHGRRPGFALLERLRAAEASISGVTKVLDTYDVPTVAEEQEEGRNLDFVGRVQLLATWGRTGWVGLREAKERATKAEADLEEEIIRWQTASGLERGGDPGGVTPEMLEADLSRRDCEMSTAVAVVEAARGHLLPPPGVEFNLAPLREALAAYDALVATGEAPADSRLAAAEAVAQAVGKFIEEQETQGLGPTTSTLLILTRRYEEWEAWVATLKGEAVEL